MKDAEQRLKELALDDIRWYSGIKGIGSFSVDAMEKVAEALRTFNPGLVINPERGVRRDVSEIIDWGLGVNLARCAMTGGMLDKITALWLSQFESLSEANAAMAQMVGEIEVGRESPEGNSPRPD